MKSLFAAALASVPTLALVPAALAADLPLTTTIDAVTVFPDGALVTRSGDIALPAGSHQVIVAGLPPGLDPASIRVEGSGDQPIVIGSAEIRNLPAALDPDTEAQRRLRDLRAELAGLNGRIDAAEMQRRAIERFATATPEAAAKEGKPIDVAQWRTAWTAIGEGAADINARLVGLRARGSDLDREIKALEATLERTRHGLAPRRDVTVAVDAAADAKARLKIVYRVGNARWTPIYDARLSTGTDGVPPKIDFVRRASIRQTSGEDWREASLVLSTTRVAGGVAAPDLGTLVATIDEPAMLRRSSRDAAPPSPAARPRLAEPAAPKELAQPAEEQEAAATAGAFSAEYHIPGRVSVGKDGTAKSVRLASREIEPDLAVKAAPALDPTAYLTARITNADEAALLPGEVLLFRDGAFVGKTRIGLTAAGDRLDLGFGADDRVKIERAPVRRRENDPSWFTSSKYQISDVRTVVTNLHPQPMRVTLVDRIPVSENTAIVIEPLRETTPPTEKQVGDKRGVMAWSWEMRPNEKKEVRVAYRMKWPADRDIRLTMQDGQ
ncbi:mucoidy inhibitor MuiA family protein [Chelatococcus reniformis]|uniref:Mucoidy inhibitor MuiA family protein n=1 Tax=Chelatococcus reniformis TaxID=1494448 RepID=A0A916UUS2_9HYPH|nr:mucoidy inhibitor MuiA family protein [Chelatococcus reniformis]GGC89362.1 hypothetical protein GCM10010994_54020 [Chelatococcus reniformis]